MDRQRQTILVVDDIPENIDVLAGILRPFYRVRAAADGARALAIAAGENKPDLILLDVMMPGINGYRVCELLKADLAMRRIPVIFVTAMSEIDDEARGFSVGAVDYITKPVSASIVLARVRTHLALEDRNRELTRLVRERTADLVETRAAVIRCLGRAAEYRDEKTGYHVIRMAHSCRLLALAAGFGEEDAELLFQAAPLHDLGKIGIPDRILNKPGKLDADEWVVMQRHAEIGALILGEHQSELLQLGSIIAATHHEKWDGSGYPKGLRGEQIPIASRIVAIADVFDALLSVRPYKPAWPVERAVAVLQQGSGRHFDPKLVPLFLGLVPRVLEIRTRYPDAAAVDAAASDAPSGSPES